MFGSSAFSQLPFSTTTAAPSGPVTHATSGALTGQGSTIVGSSTRFRAHPSTGALTGPGSIIVGAANRQTPAVTHTTTGALTGPSTIVVGSARRDKFITSSGALIGPGSIIVGAADRERQHDASGILVGAGAIIDGASNHINLYPLPSQVAAGVQYGPGGIYVGTLTVTGGETIIALRSFTGRF